MKPKTGLEFMLNYSGEFPKRNLINESSAGANAASKANNTVFDTDPLSEIVWSSDKGFSLKCVDSSFNKKSTSLFRDVEPSSMVLALLQSVTCGNSIVDRPMDDVFVQPLAAICAKSDVSSTNISIRPPTSDSVVNISECKQYEDYNTGSKSARGTSDLAIGQKENTMNHWQKNVCAQTNIENAKVSEIMEKENKSSTISGQIGRKPQENESEPCLEQNPSPSKQCKEGIDTCVDNKVVEIEDDSYTRVEHMIDDQCSGALRTYLRSSGISHSKKVKLTAEKIVQTFNCEAAATSAATSRILVSNSVQNKNKSKVNEMMLPYNKNDIHLSCENYHSKELFLASKKRYKQEVIIESKRVKMQIQETSSYSKSLHAKRDSSFMNLISNMMKGYSQSSQDDEKSPALAQIRPINSFNSHEPWKNNTMKNENCYNLELSKEKEGIASHSPISHLNNHKVEETGEQFGDNQLAIEAKKLPNFCINNETSSIGLKDEKGNSDYISTHKANHVTPFSSLRDSEPMVSMFAKRLGAIKQCQQTE